MHSISSLCKYSKNSRRKEMVSQSGRTSKVNKIFNLHKSHIPGVIYYWTTTLNTLHIKLGTKSLCIQRYKELVELKVLWKHLLVVCSDGM